MQLTRQHRRSGRPQLNMASMIDIVFLLLIFFMCTSSFLKLENEMPTQVPASGTGGGKEDDIGPIRVHLSYDGSLVTLVCDNAECGTPEAFVERLRELAQAAAAASGDPPPVIIRGEPNVPFGEMVAALDSAYEAYGAYPEKRIAFAVEGDGP